MAAAIHSPGGSPELHLAHLVRRQVRLDPAEETLDAELDVVEGEEAERVASAHAEPG